MNNNQFPVNAISHKELKGFFNNAKKESLSKEKPQNHKFNENQEFNNLIENWTETSQKILLILNKKEELLPKNKNAKSLIAYGAMSAHINMALQALKATESD